MMNFKTLTKLITRTCHEAISDGARPSTPVGWSDTDWIRHLQEQGEPHPLAGQHINQGSMDAAADAYEAEYNAAKGERVMDKSTIGHYASHQRDITAREDAALTAALRSSTVKVEHPEVARLRAELSVMTGKRDRLRDALKEYGRHKNGCWVPCNCGFDDALDEAIDAALAAKGE